MLPTSPIKDSLKALYINSPENYLTRLCHFKSDCDKKPKRKGSVAYGKRQRARALFSGVFLLLVISLLGAYTIPIFAVFLFAIYTLSAYLTLMLALFLLPIAVALGHSAQYIALTSALCALLTLAKNERARITPLDLGIGAFAVLYLTAGILFGISSFISSLIFLFSLLSYYTASRAITSDRGLLAFTDMLLLSSSLHSVWALIDFLLNPTIREEWLDPLTSGLFPRLTGAFSNPNILSVYLLFTTLLSLATAISCKGLKRYLYALSLLLNGSCLLLTYTRGAYIAFAVGAIFLILLLKPRAIRWLPFIAPPLLFFGAQGGFIKRLLSVFNSNDGSVSSRLSLLRSSLFMVRDNFLVGIGVGQERFTEAYAEYAEGGVFAPHSHNTLLQIALEGGVPLLIAFIYILYLLLKLAVSYFWGRVRTRCDGILLGYVSGATSVLVFGLFDNIFYAPHSVFLFFTVLGVLSSYMTKEVLND